MICCFAICNKFFANTIVEWFEQDEQHNTSVYVQGLPDDITEDEFKDIMSKCGLVAFDYEKKKLKLKLYIDKDTGKPKGDGLCTYIKVRVNSNLYKTWVSYLFV